MQGQYESCPITDEMIHDFPGKFPDKVEFTNGVMAQLTKKPQSAEKARLYASVRMPNHPKPSSNLGEFEMTCGLSDKLSIIFDNNYTFIVVDEMSAKIDDVFSKCNGNVEEVDKLTLLLEQKICLLNKRKA